MLHSIRNGLALTAQHFSSHYYGCCYRCAIVAALHMIRPNVFSRRNEIWAHQILSERFFFSFFVAFKCRRCRMLNARTLSLSLAQLMTGSSLSHSMSLCSTFLKLSFCARISIFLFDDDDDGKKMKRQTNKKKKIFRNVWTRQGSFGVVACTRFVDATISMPWHI